jgi:hypothetical protein
MGCINGFIVKTKPVGERPLPRFSLREESLLRLRKLPNPDFTGEEIFLR